MTTASGGMVRAAGLALGVGVVLATTAASAQTPPRTITLDVVVDGRTRAPLTASDFVVTDAGDPLSIESVTRIDASASGPPLSRISTAEDERGAASQAGRLVGVYIDEYHLLPDANLAAARTEVADFVRNGLGPRDLVAVLKPLDSLLAIRLTADRDAAAHVIETANGRQGDYVARNAFEQNFFAGAPSRIDAARDQVAVSSISALATHLGQFGPGRKTLVVVSNGITGAVRAGGALPGFDAIARAANRGHVAVYVLRPSPEVPPIVPVRDQSGRSEPLGTLAAQTTGFVTDGVGTLDLALTKLLHDASSYYQLAVTASSRAADGRYRSVDVVLRSPGAPIRARAGYALPMALPAAVPSRGSIIPEGLKIPRHASPLIRTWFGQSSAGDAQTRVAFVWEAAPLVPGDRTVRTATPARVSLKVTTLDGTEVFAGTSGPSRVDPLVPSSDAAELSFAAAPGPLVLQMEIFDTAGKTIDHDVRDLSVSAFRSAVSLGTVAVYRARAARDIRDLQEGDDRPPVVARRFSRAEHLVFRMSVRSREGTPTVSARLASGFGAAIRDLPVTLLGAAHDIAQVDVSLSSLPSGSYQVEFTGRSSGTSATERVQFTVTP